MDQKYTYESIDGYDYPVANLGNPKGLTGERSNMCYICGRVFKESQFMELNGRVFGVSCGCYRDIPKLRNR